MAAGILYMVFGCGTGTASAPCLIAFAATAGAIVYATFTWKRLYRCPACEEPVTDSEGSIPVNPKSCAHCGARLG